MDGVDQNRSILDLLAKDSAAVLQFRGWNMDPLNQESVLGIVLCALVCILTKLDRFLVEKKEGKKEFP